jgi:hypothetical protein
MSRDAYLLLADLVLALHLAFTAFIVLGLLVVWLGRLLGLGFVHNPWFRFAHLGAMGFVLLESLLGVLCPLTEWEWRLRRAAGAAREEPTFMAWLGEKLLYEDLPASTYTIIYALFFAAVVATLFLVPIRRKGRDA